MTVVLMTSRYLKFTKTDGMICDTFRGDSGKMKKNAECNTGFEMPSAEIAAFHLHR